jgi:oligosaccharide repeat unit polymerase
VSGVFLLGTALPYCFRGPLPARAFGGGLRLLGLGATSVTRRWQPAKFTSLLAGAALSFAALAVAGGGRSLWLRDPRSAYLFYRQGAGQFWLLMGWFLITALLYYIWSRRPRGLHLVAVAALFVVPAYFTGSKAVILSVLVLCLTYYNFLIRPLPTPTLVAAGITVPLAFVALLFLQGSFSSAAEVGKYFEHFDVTAQFLSRFDEFGFQYGRGWLSTFWFYVPRALYPDKPLEYGFTLLQKRLYPGAFEAGYAPGFLSWSLDYLDFGVIGVFLGGAATGLLKRAAYENFLANRQNMVAFLMMMQLSLWAVLSFMTPSAAVIWCLAQVLLLRLVLFSSARAPAPRAAPPPAAQEAGA